MARFIERELAMLRLFRLNAFGAVLAATGFLSFAAIAAQAAPVATASNIHVNGGYHSVTNGIPDYDGFDRFRDVNGNPLPGWEQVLGNAG
jgi:hypothetical protein